MPAGEMNAKAATLNFCLKQLYPRKCGAVPSSEVVVVLNAHMMPVRHFYLKMLELMQVGILVLLLLLLLLLLLTDGGFDTPCLLKQ